MVSCGKKIIMVAKGYILKNGIGTKSGSIRKGVQAL